MNRKVHFQEQDEVEDFSADIDDVDPEEEGEEKMHRSPASHDEDEEKEEKPKKKATPQPFPTNLEEAKRRLERKKWLQSETMKIIESMLDGRIEETSLRRSLSLLSKQEFNDITIERSLGRICGHPLCDIPLTLPFNLKQKFKIDVKKKVIFKMEDRSRFCSVSCLEAANFLEQQLAEESLWIRYQEHLGFDYLYAKGINIQFTPPKKTTDCNSILTESDVQGSISEESPSKREVSLKEKISFPYIKEEHLQQLTEATQKLVIHEKETVSGVTTAATEEEDDDIASGMDILQNN